MNNTLHFKKIIRLTANMILIAFATNYSYAQTERKELLDVYKIEYGFYIKATDNSPASEIPMHVEQERMEKADWRPLQVYAHTEYLYAKEISHGYEENTWLLQYKTKSLWKLGSKMAFPMNFDGFLNTDVYTTDEQVADSTYGYGRITFTEDTMTVAGYLCRRAIIHYTKDAWGEGDTKNETTVWYCPQLPKFYLPEYEYLQKIPGAALLIWHDRGYGQVEGEIALKVTKQKKPGSFFQLPKGTNILYPPKRN